MQAMLEGIHTCRNFSRIREWAWDRALKLPSIRRNVENGVIVDHSVEAGSEVDFTDKPFWHAPDNWNYRADDL